MELQNIFSLIFSCVVAIATAVYAILTWKLVNETIKMRKAQAEPKVSVTMQPRKEWIGFQDLVIKNIGKGPAYDISFEISDEFILPGNNSPKLSEIPLFEEGIDYLAPDQEIKFFLASSNEKEKKDNPEEFSITAKWKNEYDKEQKESFKINFRVLQEISQLGKPDSYKIAKNTEGIKEALEKIVRGSRGRVDVNIYTQGDRDREKQRQRERFEELRNQSEDDKG